MQKPIYSSLRIKLSIGSTSWSQFIQLSIASFCSFPFHNTIVTCLSSTSLSIHFCVRAHQMSVPVPYLREAFPSVTPSVWAGITSIPKSWTNRTESTPTGISCFISLLGACQLGNADHQAYVLITQIQKLLPTFPHWEAFAFWCSWWTDYHSDIIHCCYISN